MNKYTTIFHASLLLQSVPITQLLSYITIYPKQQPPNAIQQYNIEQRKMICPLIKRETIFFFLSYILREGRADHKIWKVGHLQNHISVSILIGHFDPGYIWESQEDLSDSIIGFCICARLTACMGSQGETKWTRKKTFVFKKNIWLLTKMSISSKAIKSEKCQFCWVIMLKNMTTNLERKFYLICLDRAV